MNHTNLRFRPAVENDLAELVAMLADDVLGSTREDATQPPNSAYFKAFTSIKCDPNNELIVIERSGQLIGMLQLTFIPYLTHIGSWRCLIEGVRVHADYRGEGLGTSFIQWAIERAKQRSCNMVQLTSDKKRPDALRFYEVLGFTASHEGFKLRL